MDLFTINLKKVLTKRLPQTVENGWSRRIEGALKANNVPTSHIGPKKI